ncbi:unnamed protein product, partial [Staurois parvus]
TAHARLRDCAARRSAVRCPPQTSWITDHGKSQRYQLGHVISCFQSQLITSVMLTTREESQYDQCALMISVAPAVPPVSVHQCLMSVLISASCHVPHHCHISVPTSAHQCHISVPI